ncbi:MAG: PEP-CTERM sorting domain-containing protein, partial [Phycisphaeraceae bacterium JB051]
LNLYDVGNTGYFAIHDFVAEGEGFLNIIVTDNGSNSSTGQTVSFSDNVTDLFGDVTAFSLDYNTYTLDGVDLSDIKQIDFYFEATSHGAAIAFGAITATTFPASIPEPASFVMLSLGCFLLMTRRDRD